MNIDPKLLALRLRSRPDGRRSGLHDSEIAAVLRALELDLLTIDDRGRLHNPTMRSPKSGGYEFLDDQGHFTAWPELATEVLAVVQLVDEHGWPPRLLKMEQTPFGVCAFAGEESSAAVAVATEEKHSPDDARSLVALMRRCERRRLQPGAHARLDPADRQDFPKYLGLRGLTTDGRPLPSAPDWFVVCAPTVWRTFRVLREEEYVALEEADVADLPRGD